MSNELITLIEKNSLQNQIAELTGTVAITDEVRQIINEMSITELRYAVAYMNIGNRKQAAEVIGISEKTLSSIEFNQRVDTLINIVKEDIVKHSLTLLEQFLPEAIMVKAQGLKSNNERVRQQTATYIIDRFVGKPTTTQNVNVNKKTAGVFYIKGVSPEDWDGELDPEDVIEGTLSHGERE